MSQTLLLLTFLFVYDTGASGTKEMRVIYWKRPHKAFSKKLSLWTFLHNTYNFGIWHTTGQQFFFFTKNQGFVLSVLIYTN